MNYERLLMWAVGVPIVFFLYVLIGAATLGLYMELTSYCGA